MKKTVVITTLFICSTLTGCSTIKQSSQLYNPAGNLITTVFDDRNSFEDYKIGDKIREEVKVETDVDTSEKDNKFWTHLINQLKNMRWNRDE